MKHGVAFRKLSRTSSHRMLMLRNLVSSLLEHGQIKTTVPKAKETARLAEKIITLGKKNHENARRAAEAFVLNPATTLPLLFTTYAERYADRPGGYTRIHKFGHRKGDHAPHAILELVDRPNDLKFEMTARAVGRETVARYLNNGEFKSDEGRSVEGKDANRSWLRELTRWNYQKVVKFRGPEGKEEFERKAAEYANQLISEPKAHEGLRHAIVEHPEEDEKDAKPRIRHVGKLPGAGERLTGMSVTSSSIGIARGMLGKEKPRKSKFWESQWKDRAMPTF